MDKETVIPYDGCRIWFELNGYIDPKDKPLHDLLVEAIKKLVK